MVLYFNPYLFAASIAQNTPYVSGNLVAYWEYSQGSGATPYSTATPLQVPDTSGSSHPIQYIVNPTPGYFSNSLTSSLNYETAYSNATVNFNNGVSFEVLFSLAQIASGQDPTIMFWDPYGGHNNGGLMLNLSASTLIPYMHNSVSGTGYLNTCNSVLSTGTWYHAVFTSNVSGYWNFYLDGYPVAYGTGFTLPTAGYDAKLGLGSPGQYVSQYGPYPYTQTMNCMFYVDMALSTPSSGSVILKDQSLNTSNLTMNTNFYSSNTLTPSLAFRTSNSVSNVYTSGAPVFSGLNTTGLTMECLFNPSGLTGNIMSLTTVSAGGVFLGFNTTSNLTVYNSGGSFSLNIAATSGTWYHSIVSINSSGAYSFYLDGLLIKSGTGFTLPSGLVTSYGLGTPAGTAFQGFQGSIGMARMYNFTLTPAQVLQNYFAVVNRVAPTNPYGLPSNFANTYVTNNLIGYWDFGKSASYAGANVMVVNDLSGNGLNMSVYQYQSPYASNGYSTVNCVYTSNYVANTTTFTQNFSGGATLEACAITSTITGGTGPYSRGPLLMFANVASLPTFGLISGDSSYGFNTFWGGARFFTAGSTTTLLCPLTQMTHYTTTIDSSGNYNMYMNGTNMKTGSITPVPSAFNSLPLWLQFGWDGLNGDAMTGQYSMGRAYSTPLTAANVWTNYGSVYQGLTYTTSSPGYVVNNLVGYWDFADSRSSSLSGSALNDLGPNGYNLTFGTSPTYQTTGALAAITSATSSASSAITPSLNFTTSGFTFECVANLYLYASLSNVISYVSGSNSLSLTFLPTAVNVVGGGAWAGSANANGGIYLSNTFAHVCAVINSTVATAASFYINGALVATQSTGLTNFLAFPTGSAAGTLSIGAPPNNTVSGLNGRIAMARVYSTALSASQVRQNYSAAFSKLYGNPYVIPPPLNQSLAFPPVFNFSATATVPYYNSVSAASYGNGQYLVTGSSDSSGYPGPNNQPPGAFSSGAYWSCAGGNVIFSASSPFGYLGSSSISTTNAGTLTGIWMAVTLPVSIIPTGVSIISTYATPYYPNVFYIAGTNNFGATWTQLGSYGPTSSPPAVGFMGNYVINSSTPYNQFAFIVNSICGTPGQMIIGKLQFYGTPVSSLAVPPGLPYYTSNAQYTTTSLVGYWDTALTASSSGTGSKILYDLSGNGNNMIFTSAPTYFQTPPCYQNTTTTFANAFATSQTFYAASIEALINFNSFATALSTGYWFGYGTSGCINTLFTNTTGNVFMEMYGPGPALYWAYNLPLATGTWNHIVLNITATTPKLYINGNTCPITVTTALTAGFTPSPTVITLGNQSPASTSVGINANIAMYRYYSNALTAPQVYQNYLHCVNKLPTNIYSLPIQISAVASPLVYWNFTNLNNLVGNLTNSNTVADGTGGTNILTVNNGTSGILSVRTLGTQTYIYFPGDNSTTNCCLYSPSVTTSFASGITLEYVQYMNAMPPNAQYYISSCNGSTASLFSAIGNGGGPFIVTQAPSSFSQQCPANITSIGIAYWYHIVVSITSSTVATTYVNGVNVYTGVTGTFTTGSQTYPYFIGARLGSGTGNDGTPQGGMAMARVYQSPLSQAQVLQNYNNFKYITANAFGLP